MLNLYFFQFAIIRGFGDFNYTLRYRDAYNFYGPESNVFITIYDIPASNNPPDDVVIQNSSGYTIDWQLIDGEGAGYYQVLLNSLVLVSWDTWIIGNIISIPVETNSVSQISRSIPGSSGFPVC